MLKKSTVFALTMACATPVIAQQSAHVHGFASINLAIENGELQIEFVSPAESIVGFEYEPGTAAERKAVADAIALLRKPENLFGLPASAECQLNEVEAERRDEHDEHKEEHAEHDEHGHDDVDEAEGHSEFHAHYHFDCEGSAIESITLRLFETWQRIETVEVQALTPNGQTGGKLDASDPVIRF